MFLKILIVVGWVFFALDVVLVTAAIVSRNMGDDAAGRGVALTFGLVGLVFVLIGGGALYFSARAHSWLGVMASAVPLALPFLLFFGTDLESYVHRIGGWFDARKEGRYSAPAQRDLAKAIEAGDFARMRKILAARPNLNGRDEAGFDLLSYAVVETRILRPDAERLRRAEGVRLLLEAGMDPNQSRTDDGGSTFLLVSSSQPDDSAGAQVFGFFLQHGANPNIRRDGQPLIFSVWDNPDRLRALLNHGADMNARDDDGNTALLFYLCNRRWDGALLLIGRGADIDVQNKAGMTATLCIASAKRMTEETLKERLPDSFYKVTAALDRRRATATTPGS
jgi:hypothetical protein